MSTAKTDLAALREYFDTPRKLSMTELKELSKEERAELAALVFEDTGWERREAVPGS